VEEKKHQNTFFGGKSSSQRRGFSPALRRGGNVGGEKAWAVGCPKSVVGRGGGFLAPRFLKEWTLNERDKSASRAAEKEGTTTGAISKGRRRGRKGFEKDGDFLSARQGRGGGAKNADGGMCWRREEMVVSGGPGAVIWGFAAGG